jgi:hypothetical protein
LHRRTPWPSRWVWAVRQTEVSPAATTRGAAGTAPTRAQRTPARRMRPRLRTPARVRAQPMRAQSTRAPIPAREVRAARRAPAAAPRATATEAIERSPRARRGALAEPHRPAADPGRGSSPSAEAQLSAHCAFVVGVVSCAVVPPPDSATPGGDDVANPHGRGASRRQNSNLPNAPRSLKACTRRSVVPFSPRCIQPRGSMYFLLGLSSPSGLPICDIR